MRTDQYWFYAHGPNGEMVIDNNQTQLAGQINIPQSKISACLRKSLEKHKGWFFRWIEEPKGNRMTPLEFRQLGAKTGLSIKNVARKLNRAESTVLQYRSGFLPIPGPIAEEIKNLTAQEKQNQPERIDYLDARARAGIRHLMENLYPGWCDSSNDGILHIPHYQNY